MKEFKNGWPKNFNDKLSHVVKTQVESGKVFNTALIYTSVIGIQSVLQKLISNSCYLISCHQYLSNVFKLW